MHSPINRSDEDVKKLQDWFTKASKPYGWTLIDCTCEDCPDVKTCDCAYDTYNTGGDCLASK